MPNRSTGAIVSGIILDRDGPIPLHRQLYEGLRQAILTGRLPPGVRLPSTLEISAACARCVFFRRTLGDI
jgi:GntR family transcriptional regulator/MocR family aminotransferase